MISQKGDIMRPKSLDVCIEKAKAKRLKAIEEYNKEPYRCKICSSVIPYDKYLIKKNDLKRGASKHVFCSNSCAAKYNNPIYRLRQKVCRNCGVRVHRTRKFCSKKCKDKKQETKIEDYLQTNKSFPINSCPSTIKKHLIRIRGHQCEICKLTEWQEQKIPLILDHVNGRCYDNTESNLRLVCGNCDMQLPTYKSKNKDSDRKHRRSLMAKAKEYAERFNTEDLNVVITDFALETRDLIDKRTKYSVDAKSKASASKQWVIDGVLREQRQKWEAVARLTDKVNASSFDNLIVQHLNDVKVEQDNWRNKLNESKDKDKQKRDEGDDGRKLANTLSPSSANNKENHNEVPAEVNGDGVTVNTNN
jgi:hypothetical protein